MSENEICEMRKMMINNAFFKTCISNFQTRISSFQTLKEKIKQIVLASKI